MNTVNQSITPSQNTYNALVQARSSLIPASRDLLSRIPKTKAGYLSWVKDYKSLIKELNALSRSSKLFIRENASKSPAATADIQSTKWRVQCAITSLIAARKSHKKQAGIRWEAEHSVDRKAA